MPVSGRQFLQIPGPSNVPDRILRAMDRPVIDHRSPEFAALTKSLVPGLRAAFGTRAGDVVLYPSSGTGGWEAALVNVLAPGDRVLSFNFGHFSAQFAQAAGNLGFEVDEVPVEWGHTLPVADLEARLRADGGDRPYRAVLVVHNETSTGVLADVAAVRRGLDAAGHNALLIVDAVSSLVTMPFCFDDWRVDVAQAASQKGLMLPPGMALLCVGPRARERAEHGGSPRNYFDWRPILHDNASGFFPYTPATLLLFGLREALAILQEEGLDQVYARHRRLAAGVRAAVNAWGLRILCADPDAYAPTVTAVVMPSNIDSDTVIARARDRFGLSLGMGLGRIKGRVLRIGHLGSLNEVEVLGTLGGVELALAECGVPITLGAGLAAAQHTFSSPAASAGSGTEPRSPAAPGSGSEIDSIGPH